MGSMWPYIAAPWILWVMNQLCYGGPAWRGDGILLISSRASRQFPRILQPSKDSGTPDPNLRVSPSNTRHDVSKAIGSTIQIFTIFMDRTNHQLIWFIWLVYDIALLTLPLNQCFIMTFRNFWKLSGHVWSWLSYFWGIVKGPICWTSHIAQRRFSRDAIRNANVGF